MAEETHQLHTANHEADEDADEEVRNLDLPGIALVPFVFDVVDVD